MKLEEIKIEKGIPIQKATRWSNFIESIEIGDSFVVTKHLAQNFRQSARRFNCKFSVRKIADNQYRVWLLEKK